MMFDLVHKVSRESNLSHSRLKLCNTDVMASSKCTKVKENVKHKITQSWTMTRWTKLGSMRKCKKVDHVIDQQMKNATCTVQQCHDVFAFKLQVEPSSENLKCTTTPATVSEWRSSLLTSLDSFLFPLTQAAFRFSIHLALQESLLRHALFMWNLGSLLPHVQLV